MNPIPNKIIVAIHGIGDQVRCETIQLVARRFAAYCAVKEDIPLGRLNATLIPMAGDPAPIELKVRKRRMGDLDVKLLSVTGLHGPRDLAAILQRDDVGKEPVANQQAEMRKNEQQDSSHNHTLILDSAQSATAAGNRLSLT